MTQSKKKTPRSRQASRPVIFVVDDEPVLLELATTLLEPLHCKVKTFNDAESALEAFTSSRPPPTLVVTDYSMHRMNGLELIEECRRLQPRQKIILISGTVDESAIQVSPVQPDHFLAKPYLVNDFVKLVQTVLAG